MAPSRLLAPALAATALLAAAVPAAAADEDIPVGGPTTWIVTGHGWGHGHGMSQYGALGAAEQGVGWKQILGFYYPGTRLGHAHGTVKVLLTADTHDVQVDAEPALRLRPLAGRKSFALGRLRPGATRWRILPKGSRSVVQYHLRTAGWHRWTSFDGDAEFTAGHQPVTVRLPRHATASYRGAIRSTGGHTVNVVPLDRYVQGVVPSEVPASWPADAIRAQAVAARTYAAYERAHATTDYDICDTSACQVYGGVDAEEPASSAAVRATAGRVVTYRDEPAFTQFSSSDGGWTSAGSEPYLVAQPDGYEAASGNPNATWTATLTSARIEKQWPAIGDLSHISFTRDGNGDFGGRIVTATFTGSTGSVTVSGDDVRYLMGDAGRSTWFDLKPATMRDLVRQLLTF